MLPDGVEASSRQAGRTWSGQDDRRSVSHVEAFPDRQCENFILGRPRRLPSHRLAGPSAERRYTLI